MDNVKVEFAKIGPMIGVTIAKCKETGYLILVDGEVKNACSGLNEVVDIVCRAAAAKFDVAEPVKAIEADPDPIPVLECWKEAEQPTKSIRGRVAAAAGFVMAVALFLWRPNV